MLIHLFLELDCTSTSASIFSNINLLSVKKGILVWLPSRRRGRIEKYSVFYFLHDRSYGMVPDLLA